MTSLRNDVHNMSDNNMHVHSKIYQEFYHGFVCTANEGCHIRITILHSNKSSKTCSLLL